MEPPKGVLRKLGHVLGILLLGDEDNGMAMMLLNYMRINNTLSGMTNLCIDRYFFVPAYAVQTEDDLAGIEKHIFDAVVDDLLVAMQGDYVEMIAIKQLKKRR